MKLDSPVLVTGARGYIAGWIIHRLFEKGTTVPAAVREPGNTDRSFHVQSLFQVIDEAPAVLTFNKQSSGEE